MLVGQHLEIYTKKINIDAGERREDFFDVECPMYMCCF